MILRYPVNYICITTYFNDGSHQGIDLGWSEIYGMNQKIYASADGIVSKVKKDVVGNDTTYRTYGNFIEITHEGGFKTFYAHLKHGSINLNVGDKVVMGEEIALMGNTGYAFGNHLHYEVSINDKDVDPTLYTYVFNGQIVANDEEYKKGILYYKDDKEDIDILRDKVKSLEEENERLREELNNYVFKFEAFITSFYKIKLYEGEEIIVKKKTID